MISVIQKLRGLVFGDRTTSEIIRFCIVGGSATLVTYGVYLVCLLFANENVSYAIGFVIGLAVNLILTTRFTFKQSFTLKTSGGFLLTHLVNFAIRLGLLNLFLWLGIPSGIAPIPAEIISVPIQYLLLRFVYHS